MSYWKYLAVAVLSMATGCAGGERGDESTTTTSSGACVDIVFIDGDEWTSAKLSAPLSRGTSGPAVRALGIECNDLVTPGESGRLSADPNRPVDLLRIDGIPASQALFDPAKPSFVYVHVGPEVKDLDRLPEPVVKLIANG